jgi:hypothetical protein
MIKLQDQPIGQKKEYQSLIVHERGAENCIKKICNTKIWADKKKEDKGTLKEKVNKFNSKNLMTR